MSGDFTPGSPSSDAGERVSSRRWPVLGIIPSYVGVSTGGTHTRLKVTPLVEESLPGRSLTALGAYLCQCLATMTPVLIDGTKTSMRRLPHTAVLTSLVSPTSLAKYWSNFGNSKYLEITI